MRSHSTCDGICIALIINESHCYCLPDSNCLSTAVQLKTTQASIVSGQNSLESTQAEVASLQQQLAAAQDASSSWQAKAECAQTTR